MLNRHRIFILLVAVLSIAPGAGFWGINHLSRFPGFPYFPVVALLCLILVMAFQDALGRFLFEAAGDRILRSRKIQIPLLACAVALFFAFRTRTHFLGDGYLLLETLGEDSVVRPANSLGYYLLSWLYAHLARIAGLTPEAFYRSVAILCGAAGLAALVLLVGRTVWANWRRALFLYLVCASGPFLLNFGYVENYALLFLFSNCFVVSGIACTHHRLSILWPSLFLGLAILSHLAALVALPAFLCLLLREFRSPTSRGLLKALAPLGVSLVLVGLFLTRIGHGFDILGAATRLDANLQNPFRPLGGPEGILSLGAMAAAANLLLLVSPPAVLTLSAGLGQLAARRTRPTILFLASHALGFLVFLLIIDPKLGAGRDWDLFCVQGTGLIALAVDIFPDHRRAAVLAVAMGFLAGAPWVLVNANPSASVDRFIAMTGTFPQYPRAYGFESLGKYYRTRGDLDSSRRMYAEAVRISPGSPRFRTLLAAASIALFNRSRDRGSPDDRFLADAEASYRTALSLDPDDRAALKGLAKLLVRREACAEARELLLAAGDISRLDAECLLALGYCEYRLGSLEGAVLLLEKAYLLDPTIEVEPWLSRARAAIGAGRP